MADKWCARSAGVLWMFITSTRVHVENITVALWNQLNNSTIWCQYICDYTSISSSEYLYKEEDESWIWIEAVEVVCVHGQDTPLAPLFELVLVSNDTDIFHQ